MEDDGLCWFEALLEKLEEEDLLFVLSLARQIWFRRNALVFGGKLSSPAQVVQCTKDSLMEFQLAQLESPGNGSSRKQPNQKWRKPQAGVLKFNWDAALNRKTNRMGVGVVVRDEGGAVLAIKCTTVSSIGDPTIAEAVAAWKAVELCCELGAQRVILEGDALEVVQALRHEDPSWSRYSQLITDARIKLN